MRASGGMAGVLRALVRPKMERTCRDCGFRWKVPRYHAVSHVESAAKSRRQSPRTNKKTREVALLQARKTPDLSAAYRRCPHCGTNTFSQRRLWTQSRDTYMGIERY
jgi:DNA-directed RNA polymerase subunit M/transcription elongation factor TFIIS